MMKLPFAGFFFLLIAVTSTTPALAATAHGIDGSRLSLVWGVPFVGLLLSIAILPLVAQRFWHHHYGKVALFWALALLIPLIGFHGADATLEAVLHTALLEYLPFIALLFAPDTSREKPEDTMRIARPHFYVTARCGMDCALCESGRPVHADQWIFRGAL